jgi:hypothetical protein
MRRLVRLLLVVALVAAAAATNGWMNMSAFAQPLGEPMVMGDDFNHCDACGGDAVVAMACGAFCVSMTAVIAQGELAVPAAQSAPWIWLDQAATTANIKPEHAPPRG